MKEHVIDVKNKRLGRVASEIAIILQGKDTPEYDPRLAGDARVVVKNIKAIKVTGNKTEDKIYYSHTTQLGHLKERTYSQVFSRKPAWVLEHAVKLMLPKNRLRKDRMKRLVIEE